MNEVDDFFTFDTNKVSDEISEDDFEDNDNEEDDDDEDDDDDDGDEIDINPLKGKLIEDNETTNKKIKSKEDDIDLEEFERNMGWTEKKPKKSMVLKPIRAVIKETIPLDKILKKSVVRDGFERRKKVPKYNSTEKNLKLARKTERSKTKGSQWYNLPATEVTDEVRRDLEILQMRSALDPKHFYKNNDMKVLPKYFHIGKVVESPIDFYSSRLTNKERKRTFVDELMADAEFAKYSKRKYKEIIEEKKKTNYKAYRQAKKLKRKKKN